MVVVLTWNFEFCETEIDCTNYGIVLRSKIQF